MANYRSSGYDLAYGDDYYGRGSGERWDRERFERMRARSRGPRGSDSVRIEEDDYYRRGPDRRDVRVEVDESRRRSGYYDPYYDDGYDPGRRAPRPEYLDYDRYEVSGRELAPYRPRYEEIPIRRPARPGMIRRQTSLDTFDRRAAPRYDLDDRDISVNVNLQAPDPPRLEVREEDYRDVRIRRERERDIYRRRRSSSSSFEEIVVPEARPKRGKTRMPKRLVHLRAILDLGHPYDEEDAFWVVRVALRKSEIDEVIEKSKVYFRETSTTVRVDESKLLEPASAEAEETDVIETKTTKIIENPTLEEIARYEAGNEERVEFSKSVAASIRSPSPTREGRRGRSRSRPRGNEIFENNSDSLTLVLPRREKSRSRREIEEEIRRLELEKKAIRRRDRRIVDDYETETITRDDDYEVVDREKGPVRIGRSGLGGNLQLERTIPKRSKSSRRPTQRDVNAALYALT